MHRKEELSADDLERPDWNSLLNNYSKHDIGEAYFKGRLEGIGMQVEHWGIDKRHDDGEDGLIFDNKMDLRLWEPTDGQEQPPEAWPADTFDGSDTLCEFEAHDEPIVPEIKPSDGTHEETIHEASHWELRGVADVKTKASESWLGKFNLRHLAHYAEWADHYEVPTFVYMTMVDTDAQSVGDKDFFVPIPSNWEWERLLDHYDRDANHSYGDMKDFARTCPVVKRTFRAPDGNLVVNIKDQSRYTWDYLVENVL